MDGTGDLLDSFVAAMSPGIKVKVLRYPVAEVLDYEGLEVLVRAELPVDEPYVLLGESFSGPVAIALAASRPPQLVGLVLCCTFARNPLPLMSVFRFGVGLLPIAAMPVGILARLLLGRFYTVVWYRALSQALAQVEPSVMRARLRAVLSVDVSRQLEAVVVPTLYLRAMQDGVVPRSAGQHLLQIKPDIAVQELKAPHFLLQVVPEEAARSVTKFVSGLTLVSSEVAI